MWQRVLQASGGESTIDAKEGTFEFYSTSNYYEIPVKQKPKMVFVWTEHTGSTDYNANSAMWIDNVQAYSTGTPRFLAAQYSSSTPSQSGYGFSQADALSSLPTVAIVSITNSTIKLKKSTTLARWNGREFKYLIVY